MTDQNVMAGFVEGEGIRTKIDMIHMTGDGVEGKGVNRKTLYCKVLEVDGNFEANKGEGKLGESQTDDVNHDGHKINGLGPFYHLLDY